MEKYVAREAKSPHPEGCGCGCTSVLLFLLIWFLWSWASAQDTQIRYLETRVLHLERSLEVEHSRVDNLEKALGENSIHLRLLDPDISKEQTR